MLTFGGEGNPEGTIQGVSGSLGTGPIDDSIDYHSDVFLGPDGTMKVYLTLTEQEALSSLLERETTSRPSYDGLRQLLSLSHPHAEALLGFLRRIKL